MVSDSSVRGFQAGQLRNAFLKCPFLSVLYAACMWVPTGQGKVKFCRAGETGHELPSVGAGAKLQSSRRAASAEPSLQPLGKDTKLSPHPALRLILTNPFEQDIVRPIIL